MNISKINIVLFTVIFCSAINTFSQTTFPYISNIETMNQDSITKYTLNINKRKSEIANITISSPFLDLASSFYVQIHVANTLSGIWQKELAGFFKKVNRINYDSTYLSELLFDKIWLDTLDKIVVRSDSGKIVNSYSFYDNTELKCNRTNGIATKYFDVEFYCKDTNYINSYYDISYTKLHSLANTPGPGTQRSYCQIDVNDYPSISNFEDAKNATVLLYYDHPDPNKSFYGTGTLINNTHNDATPLVITCGHNWIRNCSPGNSANITTADLLSPIYMKAYINFYNPSSSSYIDRIPFLMNRSNYLLGAQIMATMCEKDMLLYRFSERPDIRKKVHFAGWDIEPQLTGTHAVLGHPGGQVQSIVTWSAPTFPVFNGNTSNGVFQAGQSGSALFDPDNNIVGIFNSTQDRYAVNCFDPIGVNPNRVGNGHSIALFYTNEGTNSIINYSFLAYYLNPTLSNISRWQGMNYCPQNQVTVNNGAIPGVFYRDGYRQVYKSVNWELTNWQNSMEVQASDYIRIKNSPTGHQNAIRITGGSTRMRAFACASNTNPQNRKESDENKAIDDIVTAKKLDLLWSAYPNPAKDNLALRFKTHGNYTITVISMQGKVVKQLETGETSDFNLSIADILNGVYQVAVSNSEKIESIKLVKY